MSVTSVTLGNFFTTSNGKNVLGGAGGSGLDTQALVTSLVAVASQPATQDQTQITQNNQVSSALTTFNTLVSTLQNAAQALSNPPGVNNAANNAFQFTIGSVGNGGSAYVGVTTSPGAALQTYNISDISSIASDASQGTGTFSVASADADATTGTVSFTPGTIDFNGGTVTVASGDSLNIIAAKFNAVSSTTGIAASVVQVGSGNYQMSFTATNTGSANSFDLSTGTDNASVLANVGLTTAVPGTDAIFKLNGIQITRSGNSVSDVINNVTFNILQQTPDSTTNYAVSVQPDTTTIQNTIVGFVNAYNALQTFAAQQTQLNTNGTFASTAILATNQSFRNTMEGINSNIVSQVAGIASGQPSSLSDVGITFTNQPASGTTPAVSNILTVDDGQLTSALSSNFSGVANLFEFNMTSDNPNLIVYSHTNPISANSFTLNIDPGSSTFTATYDPGTGPVTVDLTAEPLSGSTGYTLAGPAGSALDGLTLIYASDAAATISVNATQGLADTIYNTSNAATTQTTGTIALAQQQVTSSNQTLNDDITRVNLLVSQYQNQLLNQFSALEQAISSTNTLLQSLNANENAALVAANA